jgi:hypothetical protein
MKRAARVLKPAISSVGMFTAVGLLLLATMGASIAVPITNGSFEDPAPDGSLNGWTDSGVGGFGRDTVSLSVFGLPSDGNVSGRIYSPSGEQSFSVGEYGSVSQAINLTNVSSIVFDAAIGQCANPCTLPTDPWASFLEAAFLVDGVTKWTKNTTGGELGVVIDVSSLFGMHTIEFQNRIISDAINDRPSYWFMFDNVRATETSEVPAPPAIILFASGLAVIGVLRRRRYRASE